MRTKTAGLWLWMGIAACAKQAAPPASAPAPSSETDKTLYALGVFHAKNLAPMKLSPAELAWVQAGLADQTLGKPLQVDLNVYGPKAQNIVMARANAATLALAAAQKAKDAPFLVQAAKEPGAVTLPSGVVMKTLTPGAGESPKIADRVRVRYEGHLTDGTVFDSTEKHGDEARFAMVTVMPCWNEALQRMKVGEVDELTCPPQTAFGDRGREPKVPGGATLIFKVALLEINPQEPPIKRHALVKPPPRRPN